jgi:hypothetical protein
MNLFKVIQDYSEQIGGTFTNYDSEKCIIIVPLKDNRFQTVICETGVSKVSGKSRMFFSSKVSNSTDQINAKELMSQNKNFDYSRFIIDDGQLKIEASCLTDSATEDEIKFMLQEVGQLADQYELRLTGKDIF